MRGDRVARVNCFIFIYFGLAAKGYGIYPIDFVAKRIATLGADEPGFGFFSGMADVSDAWQ